MSPQRVVVDGSNIATEGRSLPSLVQLDEAVRGYREEHPVAEIIVVVDATFAHRIDESERVMFEEAAAHNELVYPPAGAVGRGDAFLLRIAEKTQAIVLSNDSFQEFHGEHEWLFDRGRLIGGTPVPGVGWIFVARTPVRGPKSREAVKEAKRGKPRVGSKDASQPMPVPKAPPPRSKAKDVKAPKVTKDTKDTKDGKESKPKPGRLKAAIEEATEEAVTVDAGKGSRNKRRRKRKGAAPVLPTVNEPLTFIQFIAEHQPGAKVEAEIESFASHGAFVLVGDARCYIPLSAMGEPPPRSAREVLTRGQTRTFIVQALDAPRRGIELALPGFEHVAGRPTDETVEAEIEEAPPPIAPGGRGRKKAAAPPRTPQPFAAEPIPSVPKAPREIPIAPVKPAKKPPAKKPVAKKPAAKTTEPAKKTAPKKAAAKKQVGKKPAAKKAPAKKTVAKKAPTTKTIAKKAVAKKPLAKKTAPTGKKAPATKTVAKKAWAAKRAPAKKVPAKKVPAKKAAVAKRAPASKKKKNAR